MHDLQTIIRINGTEALRLVTHINHSAKVRAIRASRADKQRKAKHGK